ncbi:MAG: hypothetical protein UX79_C0006G0054 [candidate division WWE3 bacterium GW2011_GWB1_47_11]|uniref:Uncharacterized protein n=2 Tax=Katanobacteria TaxID=422282 RepID=A0A0G1TUA5_UNCKA|nr:MAG: hypothetical protein UX69_C0013G0016 [candidate division WWE3 bacterium GW2011_GWA2_46_9]KKU57718.1 MAG: hypothetical protein UX79_C0006G0054 [candidate division WWE3 bacterium GW2011_GWB1_47_11]
MSIGSKTSFQYKSILELKPKRLAVFICGLALAHLVGFGLFGVVPGIRALDSKLEYVRLLKVKEAALANVISNTEENAYQLQAALPYWDYFQIVMPVRAQTEEYLVDFVTAASEHGFVVNSFRIFGETETEVSINTELIGAVDNISNLINGVEGLKRVTQIKKMVAFNDKASPTVQLVISIYKKPGNL